MRVAHQSRREQVAAPGRTRQDGVAKKYGDWQHLPIIYLSQMVGRAIGVPDAELGLNKHMVDVMAVMG